MSDKPQHKCATCGTVMRKGRIEYRSAIKGDDNWDDTLMCPNEQCRNYVKPAWWHHE